VKIGKRITAGYLDSRRNPESMGAGGDQFEQMTLARAVRADDTHEPRIVIKCQFNVFEVSPLIDSNVSYTHLRAIPIQPFWWVRISLLRPLTAVAGAVPSIELSFVLHSIRDRFRRLALFLGRRGPARRRLLPRGRTCRHGCADTACSFHTDTELANPSARLLRHVHKP
jgi:hypothetical protein